MNTRLAAMATLLLPALLAGCSGDRRDSLPVVDGVLQTKVPGEERTGGGTSGAVMAAAGGRKPADPGPAGTPGIPLGSGGNTGGAEMGAVEMGAPTKGPVGTGPAASGGASAPTAAASGATSGWGAASGATPGTAPAVAAGTAPGTASGVAPGTPSGVAPGSTSAAAPGTASAAAPAAPASAAAAPNPTQRAEVALAESIDAVARRWRTRAAEQGWPMYPPTPVNPLPSIKSEASLTGSAPSGQPDGRLTAPGAAAPKTSEKHGTAAPSPDVKTATKPPTQPSVKARAPDAVN